MVRVQPVQRAILGIGTLQFTSQDAQASLSSDIQRQHWAGGRIFNLCARLVRTTGIVAGGRLAKAPWPGIWCGAIKHVGSVKLGAGNAGGMAG